jgi:uncharacterized protein
MRRIALCLLLACTTRGAGGRALAGPPPAIPVKAAQCADRVQSAPLIVEWPTADRAKIEALASKGLVLLHYEGCHIEVVAQCGGPGSYGWTGTTRRRDRVVLTERDELYANIPLGAASLEGTLARTGSLRVEMTMVGRYESDRGSVRGDELKGDACARVTHVVTAITVGAFRFATGTSGKVGASAGVLGAKTGGASESATDTLAEDGDESACAAAKAGSSAPPLNCAAPLRLELVPLGQAKKASPVCPTGTAWDGAVCKDANELAQNSVKCAANDAAACVTLGTIYERAREGTFAAAAYGKACDRGGGEGCGRLAAMHLDGELVPVNAARAATLFDKGCELHHSESCTWLGHMLRMGVDGAVNLPRSTQLYTRGCDMNDAFACYWLADAHLEARGTPKDQPRAMLILKRLCEQKHALSCTRLKSL